MRVNNCVYSILPSNGISLAWSLGQGRQSSIYSMTSSRGNFTEPVHNRAKWSFVWKKKRVVGRPTLKGERGDRGGGEEGGRERSGWENGGSLARRIISLKRESASGFYLASREFSLQTKNGLTIRPKLQTAQAEIVLWSTRHGREISLLWREISLCCIDLSFWAMRISLQ